MSDHATDADSLRELTESVRLFARLLLQEIDAPTLERLCEPGVRESLAEVGVTVPRATDLERLAGEFFAVLLNPNDRPPLVQSLWVEGKYEGDTTLALRSCAAAAGVGFDKVVSRGAPPDHLGCILLLWCETLESAPEIAARIAQQHLDWAPRALEGIGRGHGFYHDTCRALARLVKMIRSPGD